jgi:uncharacterized protein YjbI with pentapeptide repeats
MGERVDVPWPVCEVAGCTGIQLASGKLCLAHADGPERDAALNQVSMTGVIDARGVQISDQLLEQILAAAPRGQNGKALFNASRFHRAIFDGDVTFDGVTFGGDADFHGVTFGGKAGFGGATFSGRAVFNGATFRQPAAFGRATFSGQAGFSQATFSSRAGFRDATFSRALFDLATFFLVDFVRVTFTGDAGFRQATFTNAAWFRQATFTGDAEFRRATFSGVTEFRRTTFTGDAEFSAAAFSGITEFRRTTFTGEASFSAATFSRRAGFRDVTFSRRAGFRWTTFTGEASFRDAIFVGDANFGGATFSGNAGFGGATFSGGAGFGEVSFRHRAAFHGARFERARQFGPVLAYRGLDLDGTEFTQAVQIEVSTTGFCCRGARFPVGVQFRLRWARVVLDDADFPEPSILTGIPHLSSERLAAQEQQIAKAWQRLLAGEISERPQLLSLRRANVARLTLDNVTLADCRFAAAHNLDTMRLEADASFTLAPSPLGRLSWEGRQVIAEERDWRADRSHRWGWTAPPWPDWLGERPDVLEPGQIADLYRALRKGREEIKNEPGAADFYYGEMEMRRFAHPTTGSTIGTPSRGRAERGLLTAYWLASGYGLRASRALATLLLVLTLATVGFAVVGFAPSMTTAYQQVAVPGGGTRYEPQPIRGAPPGWAEAATYSVQSTTSLLRAPATEPLTESGRVIEIVLRLLGPLLLGLALLALRGRVKR